MRPAREVRARGEDASGAPGLRRGVAWRGHAGAGLTQVVTPGDARRGSPARGFTLVEQMVTVAIIGILGVLFDSIGTVAGQRATEELQRARAELYAGALVREAATGVRLGPEVRARLARGLPRVEVKQERVGPHAVVVFVGWEAPGGRRLDVTLSGVTP